MRRKDRPRHTDGRAGTHPAFPEHQSHRGECSPARCGIETYRHREPTGWRMRRDPVASSEILELVAVLVSAEDASDRLDLAACRRPPDEDDDADRLRDSSIRNPLRHLAD